MRYLCGCYYHLPSEDYHTRKKNYLPLLDSEAHTTILSTTSRTVLKQKFTNPSSKDVIKECIYTFPLYDGVSVVSFTCRIGEKVLRGLVKEKIKAKAIYDDAVSKGETAGLLEQAPQSSDVFSTKLGNIPAGESVIVEITYIGELKHHENEGIRFTIPTSIAPRYGSGPSTGAQQVATSASDSSGIKLVVDINMPEGSFIKGVQSPSHPIAVSMGTVSTATADDPLMSKASATLSLGSAALEKDFVLIVQSKDIGVPKAVLETHPTIQNHRALMATLVPKFSLPPSHPEIVFVADRSGSMRGNIEMLVSAMKVFLKSLPAGTKFNICSFGSSCSFLWEKSRSYTKETLDEATAHLATFQANMGGTETFSAIKATVDRRFTDIPLEVMLLTDGDIWQQDRLFEYVNQQVEQTNGKIRVFPLGIGNGVSHSLIEGLARAGNGFAQAVQIGERLENSVVRMLRGALSPHITDYTLEVKYAQDDDDFEVIDKVTDGMKVMIVDSDKTSAKHQPEEKPKIALFNPAADPEQDDTKSLETTLPSVPPPKLLQAPHKIPSLFAFSRTTVYLLMSPDTVQRNPTAVVLRATSDHGPLELEIPIEVLSTPDQTIHQLAAKKAVQDLEEGRGWIYDAKNQDGVLIKDKYPSSFNDLVKHEAIRIGEKFQIAGKYCSFVAVAANDKESSEGDNTGHSEAFPPQDVFYQDLNYSERSLGSFDSFSARPSQTYHMSARLGVGRDTGNLGGETHAFARRSQQTYAFARPSEQAYYSVAAPPSQPMYQKSRSAGVPGGGMANHFGATQHFASSGPPSQPQTGGTRGGWRSASRSGSAARTNYHSAPSGAFYGRSAALSVASVADEEEKTDAFGSQSLTKVDWSSKSAAEKVLELISLQSFEGSWSVDSKMIGEIIGVEIPEVPQGGDENVWVTLLVINFLEQKMAAEEGTWALVVEKARGRLATLELDNLEGLEKEAFEVIGKQ